ncbi:MAG: sulfatase [Acidimicrobiales bacterium]|nr:sulfatase [Acidimicrobiales bacterium]
MVRQNVLYLTVDEWRGDCLSALGHPVVETPNLDRLAARGVLFTNHWAVTAPCGPSRASLHTGMYLMNHRSVENGTPLDDRFTNVAREARAAGYDPVLFGYTDTTVDPRTVSDPADPRLRTYEGVLPGFRAEVLLTGEDLSPWLRWLEAHGIDVPANPHGLFDPRPDYPGADAHGRSWAPTRFPAERTETAFLTESVMGWLDRHGGEPWFLHASYIRPHPPFRAPEGYHDRYDPEAGAPFRRHPDRDIETALHPIHQFAVQVVGCDPDEREARQTRATYWANMAEVDDQIGRLLDHLDASGLVDDTLIVLTSDHGDQMGDHWLLQKLGWWDESYHVPLIVVDPRPAADGTRGSRVDAVTEHVDVMPTICDWMGVEVPLQCDGRALQPFVHDGLVPGDWRHEAHIQWDFRNPQRHMAEDMLGLTMEQCCLDVVRGAQHKYVHFADGTALLFDLDADPDQLVDVSADPAYADVVADLRGRLLTWRMRHDERTLTGHLVTHGGLVVRRDPRV